MSNNTKNTIIVGISVAAIIISLVAITMPLLNTSKVNIQNYTGQKREFWLFNSAIPEFNETATGMPHDAFSMQTMSVFKGDKVVIHFFNSEDPSGDNHSFTLSGEAYNINVVAKPGENKTIIFDANTTGTFTYFCTFHQPTMRGQLIVQPLPN